MGYVGKEIDVYIDIISWVNCMIYVYICIWMS